MRLLRSVRVDYAKVSLSVCKHWSLVYLILLSTLIAYQALSVGLSSLYHPSLKQAYSKIKERLGTLFDLHY